MDRLQFPFLNYKVYQKIGPNLSFVPNPKTPPFSADHKRIEYSLASFSKLIPFFNFKLTSAIFDLSLNNISETLISAGW